MSSCCGLGAKDGPGRLSGKTEKIGDSFRGKPLIRIFEDRLKKKQIEGTKTAIQFQDRTALSYTQLNIFASCLAKGIIERLGYDYRIDNPDGELLIAVCMPMSEKAIALVLGILKTGAAYLPLDWNLPENLLLEIVSTFRPVMLITDDNGKIYNKYDTDSFASIAVLCSVEELWLDLEFPTDRRSHQLSTTKEAWQVDFLENRKSDGVPLNERPVAVLYSRGLCQNVSGVRLSTRSIINLILHHWKKVKNYSRKDSCCVTVPLSDSISIPQIFIPLLCGCTIHLFRRLDVLDTDNFVKNLSWRNINKLAIETYLLNGFLESIEFLGGSTMVKLLKLRTVSCRGAFIHHETVKLFFSIFTHGVTLMNCLGGTEVSGEIALEQYHSLSEYESKLISSLPTIGSIIENVKIYILDENMNLVPDGTKGEIYVSGDCLAIGYVNEIANGNGDNGSTKFMKNPFSDNPKYARLFKSGEHASIQKTAEGLRRLFVYGRQDALVRVRGHIFSTDDVTEYVKKLDGVKNAIVCAYHAGRNDQLLVVFLELNPGVENVPSLPAEYEFTLKNQLPEWAVPDEFKVFPGCLPECKVGEGLCPECCIKIFENEMEEKNKLMMANPHTAQASNQFG